MRNLARIALTIGVSASITGCGETQSPVAPLQARTDYQQLRNASSDYNFRVIFSFGEYTKYYGYDPRGADPAGGLIDVGGTLYGTTLSGGHYSNGTVFSITRGGRERVLHSFQGIKDGQWPLGELVAVNGKLYGSASGGGDQQGDGTVFSVDPSGQDFHVLHQFAGGNYDGSEPFAGLVSAKGWLYGTTYYGGGTNGGKGSGTVFGIKLSDGKIKILHSFAGGSDGCGPMAPVIYSHGMLYGTTWQCGSGGLGTVFSVEVASSKEKVIHSFSGSDGATPEAGLVLLDGVLYGTTNQGGADGKGSVFSLTTAGDEHVLHSFSNGDDGGYPAAALIVGATGILYGTTYYGGAKGYGTVFSIGASGLESVLHSFGSDRPDGIFPRAPLLYLAHKLYGTTYHGGRHGHHCLESQYCDYGTVFKLDV